MAELCWLQLGLLTSCSSLQVVCTTYTTILTQVQICTENRAENSSKTDITSTKSQQCTKCHLGNSLMFVETAYQLFLSVCSICISVLFASPGNLFPFNQPQKLRYILVNRLNLQRCAKGSLPAFVCSVGRVSHCSYQAHSRSGIAAFVPLFPVQLLLDSKFFALNQVFKKPCLTCLSTSQTCRGVGNNTRC